MRVRFFYMRVFFFFFFGMAQSVLTIYFENRMVLESFPASRQGVSKGASLHKISVT